MIMSKLLQFYVKSNSNEVLYSVLWLIDLVPPIYRYSEADFRASGELG